MRKKVFTVKMVRHRDRSPREPVDGCPIPGSVQVQAGGSCGQPGLGEGVLAHGGGGWN